MKVIQGSVKVVWNWPQVTRHFLITIPNFGQTKYSLLSLLVSSKRIPIRGLSKITMAFFGIFWPCTSLFCTLYVANYTFFWPPTHPKCRRNLWKAPIGKSVLFSTIWNRTIPGIVLGEFVLGGDLLYWILKGFLKGIIFYVNWPHHPVSIISSELEKPKKRNVFRPKILLLENPH